MRGDARRAGGIVTDRGSGAGGRCHQRTNTHQRGNRCPDESHSITLAQQKTEFFHSEKMPTAVLPAVTEDPG